MVPALTALNARLRDDYVREIQAGLDRWNRIPDQFGIPFRFTLPHIGFQRHIGKFAGHHVSPAGEVITESAWNSQKYEWIPSPEDNVFIESLMGRVVEPEDVANLVRFLIGPKRSLYKQVSNLYNGSVKVSTGGLPFRR